MVAERTTEPGACDGCRQADTCKEAYRRLGSAQGPSVTREVLIAFLLPIAVFVAALGGFGLLLGHLVPAPYATPLALVLAVAVAAASLLLARALVRPPRKK
jgi:hypothetical protein